MVSITQLLTWESTPLDQAADGLYAVRRQLVDLQDEVDGSRVPGTWWGDASTAATQEYLGLVDRLRDITAEVAKVAASLDLAGHDIKTARQALEDALGAAQAQGFEVDHTTGEVTDPHTYEDTFDLLAATVQVGVIAGEISDAVAQGTLADSDLARALVAATNGEIDGGDGTLADAGDQLPAGLDTLTPAEIAEKYGENVVIDSLSAWLSVEAELAGWEVEGYAQAGYQVMADGSVKMSLTLEAGLGREIDVGGAELDASAGGTTTLELTFKDQAEADAFLDGLGGAITDLGFGDIGNVPAAVAQNVAEYVMKEDITSFRTGVYAKGSVEFETPVARGEGEARMEGYYDWATDRFGIKLTASADADLGEEGSGVSGSGELTGDIQFDGNDMTSAVLEGKISAALANEKLGIDVPGTSTGQGVDVRLAMDRDNPRFDDFSAAINSGDVASAVDIAYNDAEVVVRSTTIESYASEEINVDIKVAELDVEIGATGELANDIVMRPAGQGYWVDIDPEAVRQ